MIPLEPLANGKIPKHRIEEAANAQTIVVNLWDAAKVRQIQNAAIQGQINGNPPYDPAKLRQAGRAGDANFNTLEAKALCSTAMVPYYDLFAGGNRYVEIGLDIGDDFQSSYAAGIAAEEYDAMLRRWCNFEFVMYQMMGDYTRFGKGFLVWSKNGSWHLQKIGQNRVLVPDGTPIDLTQLELFVIFQDWTVTYLMDQIRDTAAARALGWDIQETKDAIRNAVPKDPTVPNDPMAIQQSLRDADIYASARNSTVQCATVFVREFDGKWSELIVRRDQIPSQSQSTGPVAKKMPQFMFKRYSYYDSVYECLLPFFFEPADGDWNSSAGIGRDIFVPMQLKDRIECSRADSVFLRNSILMQPRQETDRTKINMMQIGKMTILPTNMDVQESTILGDITSTIEVGRELSMLIEKNTGIYRPTLEKGGGNPDTLGEFQTKFAQATVLSSSAITRFYSQMDRLYEEQWRRVYRAGTAGKYDEDNENKDDWENEARRFISRCEARGVDREWLKKPKFVRAFRAIGQGSAAMRQQIVSTFLNPNVFPLYPEDGQQNILEDFTRTLGGQTAVARYMPASSRMGLPNNDQWDAMQENATMKIGSPALWTPRQNNIIHAQTHLAAASQAAASLEQGANPVDVLAYVDALGAHIAEHLQRESAVPTSKAAVKALEEKWKRLAKFADDLRQKIQASADQQQELQEEQQQVLTEADIKRMDVQMKNQISREKAAATLQLKAERQNAELALKARGQEAQTAMADASTAAEITRKTAQTQVDIDSKRAKAAESSSSE